MWRYEKRLQFPVKIQTPNARLAKAIVSQLGGPDGELAASLRYLSQRYAMPTRENMALLTDIGTEELAHMEIISAIIRQLTQNLTLDQIRAQGFDDYYVDHTLGIWPQAASGAAFTAAYFQSKGCLLYTSHADLQAISFKNSKFSVKSAGLRRDMQKRAPWSFKTNGRTEDPKRQRALPRFWGRPAACMKIHLPKGTPAKKLSAARRGRRARWCPARSASR